MMATFKPTFRLLIKPEITRSGIGSDLQYYGIRTTMLLTCYLYVYYPNSTPGELPRGLSPAVSFCFHDCILNDLILRLMVSGLIFYTNHLLPAVTYVLYDIIVDYSRNSFKLWNFTSRGNPLNPQEH